MDLSFMNILLDTDYWKIFNQDKRLKKNWKEHAETKFMLKTSGFIELSLWYQNILTALRMTNIGYNDKQ